MNKNRSYMFQSSTIVRELAMNLAKVIFMLKHSAKLHRYLLCGCMAACHRRTCVVCCAEHVLHSIQHTHHSMTCCHTTTK